MNNEFMLGRLDDSEGAITFSIRCSDVHTRANDGGRGAHASTKNGLFALKAPSSSTIRNFILVYDRVRLSYNGIATSATRHFDRLSGGY